jgi:hypothetical protein
VDSVCVRFISYFRSNFHMPSSNDSIFIDIKLKAAYIFHATAIVLSYIPQNIPLIIVVYLWMWYNASFQDPKLSVVSNS